MSVREGTSLDRFDIVGRGATITVLHVDDDAAFVDLAATFLERESDSIRVLTETSVEDGQATLRDHEIDCIVSDYDMPGENGLEFLETVRQAHPKLPFVLFTGKGSEEIASEAISAGVTEYLQKESGTDQYTVLANRIEQAVKRRRAEEEVYRGFQAIESAQEGIGIIGADGTYRYVNRSYADIYDRDVTELVGEHWETLYPDAEAERFHDEILPTLERRGTWVGESVGVAKGGERVPESLALTQMDDGGHVCVVRDISERKARERELRREQQFLYTTLEALGDLFYAFDEDLNLLRWNDRVETVTGYSAAELDGRSPREVFGDGAARVASAIDTAVSERRRVSVEAELSRENGETVQYEFTGAPVEDDGELLGVCGVGRSAATEES
jgi:PAS domain S-box-containing protein